MNALCLVHSRDVSLPSLTPMPNNLVLGREKILPKLLKPSLLSPVLRKEGWESNSTMLKGQGEADTAADLEIKKLQ